MTEIHGMTWPPRSDGSGATAPADAEVVVVHDGTPPASDHLDRLLAQLGDSAVVAVATIDPVTDAVKQLDDDGLVAGTVDRAALARIGLPQVVRAAGWARVAAHAEAVGDTPAALLLRSGAVVAGVPRHPS